ncbi:hypothetical protein [Halosolutus halophilus]|uniref:hypothetical protein n=1 Tax=Halosolutus halophilus TaxID=1552990 RepID=UPI00223520A1|nr:hypothetical protein [Halosolutus halophilus]
MTSINTRACTPHEDEGMVGSVVVGRPDPADQPGLTAPDDDLPAEAVEQLERFNDEVRAVLENGEQSHEHDGGHDDDGNDHDH